MTKWKEIWRAVAITAIAMASVAAHAESTLQRAQRTGTIRIGFANEAPYGYADMNGDITGEAPEVAKAVLKKMGIKDVVGVLTDFGSLIPGLQAGRFDVIAAGMAVTPARCQQVLFSEPSYGMGEALLVKKGNPEHLKDFQSLASKPSLKLAVMAGTVEVGYADQAGVKSGQLVQLSDQPSLVSAVQTGRADAAALTALSIQNMAKKADDVDATSPFQSVGGKSVTSHGAFGFRKADVDLRDAFNKVLVPFIGSPEHIALVTPFGFGKGFLPIKKTEEICAGQ
ncbi:putative amino-acid ABC transporter periplasmic-binding protein y4tE [Burkholderia sp. 8Y]|uniref:ectoine/hydroxyectoine ABC transporter substrate-binding protein EhuB n=1 Tax=Burkholderia sp. 8Y TaxID=2653133 RepID=UPI0012F328A2|nr:ectoine/hydroxyectoine ABC transporter substrate-binding protein EhuB [Burkholderia sp. 8Y]VXC79668.1 putative amino-acid ABC transporter periplasmic-binding protein y4tE [Burkholderia sp. 8Y]